MPLVRIDAVEGRSPEKVSALLEAAHRAVAFAFKVPLRDRYQVYHEHPRSHMVMEDTGLGIDRTLEVIVITVISRPRDPQLKQIFYSELCRELMASCGIAPSDVIVSITINSDADWSFGHGRAQFLTGEL